MTDLPLVRVESVLAQELDGEVLLLRPGSSEVLHLDPVTALLWHRLAEPATFKALTEHLCALFDERPERVPQDVLPALADLQAHGMLRETDEPPGA